MSMALADLIEGLRRTLHDAHEVLKHEGDATLKHVLEMAAIDLGRHRPLIKHGELALVSGTAEYSAPARIQALYGTSWGEVLERAPWDVVSRMPDWTLGASATGDQVILFHPPPSSQNLCDYGSTFRFRYAELYLLDPDGANTTVPAALRDLLLLRGQAELMKELAMRNMAKPVALRDGMSGMPKNGTPAALYEQLMREFKAAA